MDTTIEANINSMNATDKPVATIDAAHARVASPQPKGRDGFLERVAEGAKSYAERVADKIGSTGVTTVFGQPVEREGVTVIPVARAMWGFGAGTGLDNPSKDKRSTPDGIGVSFGDGGGGGVMIGPVGYIELTNGRARFRPIVVVPVVPLAIAGGVVLAILVLRGLRSRP